MRRLWGIVLLLGLLMAACSTATNKQAEPVIGFQKVADQLDHPVMVVHAGDGSGRLFILEQPGRIRVVQGGRLLPEPFLDITAQVTSTGLEQGLIGLAFDPSYRQSGVFFVHYTGENGRTVVARYRVSRQNPNRANPGSGEVLLTHPQPFANHNGGTIRFGPDGYLYIGLGDGGGAGDPHNNAQNLQNWLGKILRIDPRLQGSYRIPPDNPFVGKAGRDEIWNYGLRNPWQFSFDRKTGDLWIADAGQDRMEEVNFEPAGSAGGRNYGWRVWEGTLRYTEGEAPGAVFPVVTYRHNEECVIAGGGCLPGGGHARPARGVPLW
jgi:glucose/arabinose dehydrogenase